MRLYLFFLAALRDIVFFPADIAEANTVEDFDTILESKHTR